MTQVRGLTPRRRKRVEMAVELVRRGYVGEKLYFVLGVSARKGSMLLLQARRYGMIGDEKRDQRA